MSNLAIGNEAEKDVSSIFREKGFWCHVFARGNNGSQPVDLVAIRGKDNKNEVYLADVKHVRTKEVSFDFKRIEPNQWSTLGFAYNFAHIDPKGLGFIVQFDRTGEFYWLPYLKALYLTEIGSKSVNLNVLEKFERVLDDNENNI